MSDSETDVDAGGDEESEEPRPWYPTQGPNREGMTDSYLPGEEDWVAKTQLEINDDARVSVLRQMGAIYPEVDDLQPLLDQFLDQFLRARTSVGGQSRDEYKSILRSMYGGGPDDEHGVNFVMEGLGADED